MQIVSLIVLIIVFSATATVGNGETYSKVSHVPPDDIGQVLDLTVSEINSKPLQGELEGQISEVSEITEDNGPITDNITVSRQQNGNYRTFEISAYTLREQECGKSANHKDYGITASGTKVAEGRTIAAPPGIPFGTKIYIPYFDKTYTVEDRGGAIKGNRLDVYMDDYGDAISFGRRKLDIQIIE